MTGQRHGAIAWHYDINDSALDFLGANDVVKLTYTVQVDDGNGGIKTAGRRHHGARHRGRAGNHVVGTGGDDHRDCRWGTGREHRPHTATGAVTFNDVDLSDIETSSIYRRRL